MKKYYELLELSPGASAEQVRQAYMDLVRVWHPDRFPNNARLQRLATRKFMEITQAYYHLMERLRVETGLDRHPFRAQPYGEGPIDWRQFSRPSVAHRPEATQPPAQPAPQAPQTRSRWRWHFTLVGIPLLWILVIVGLELSRTGDQRTSISPDESLPAPKISYRSASMGWESDRSSEDTTIRHQDPSPLDSLYSLPE